VENEKILTYILEHYGVSGLFMAYIFWEKFLHPQWKKSKGTYVSYSAIKEQMNSLENKLNGHLVKENVEDIMFAKLETDHENLKDKIQTETGHIFGQLASIHERLDQIFEILAKK